MKKYLLLLFVVVGVGIGCYEDTDTSKEPEVIIEIAEVFITTSISGSVLDKEGNPISDYSIMINDEVNPVSQDQFYINMDGLKKKGQTIHVMQEGKKIGMTTELLLENDINYIQIRHHEPYNELTLNDNTSVLEINEHITANVTRTQWTNGYQGEIKAEYTSIEPSIALTSVGYDVNSDLLAIKSFGGFYLSFENGDGEKILAQDAYPIIIKSTELDAEVNGLFSFDEKDEVWVFVSEISANEEVEITGSGYYTFANYTPGVFVEGRVIKEDNPVAYQSMRWELASMSNDFNATEAGKWITVLPEKDDVVVQLLNPCGDLIQNENISVGGEDLRHPDVVAESSDNYQKLDMKVLDCEGEEVANPKINLSDSSDEYRYHFSDSYANSWIPVCGDFEISAWNSNPADTGSKLNWSTEFSSGLDVLTNCNEHLEGFSYIKIREDEKIYSSFNILREGDRFMLSSMDDRVKLIVKGTGEGDYEMENINIVIDDPDFGEAGYYIKCENSPLGCGIEEFSLTHFDEEEGGTVRASFSGILWMQTIEPSVAGNFEVEGVILIKL